MHELSLAESAIDMIGEAARREGFKRVRTIFMDIGRLSCVDPEALRTAFDMAARGTCAEAAMLEIHCVEGLGECSGCQLQAPMETLCEACPQCGGPLTAVRGTEMRVIELDVEAE